MKKAFIATFILLLVTGVFAQETKIMGGINFSNYSGTNVTEKPTNKTGYVAGIGLESHSNNIAIEVDILYFQKGCTRKMPDDYVIKYLLTEISIPLLLKINILSGSSPFIVAGGEGAYVVSYKTEQANVKYDAKKYAKSIDYGLVFGAGFELITEIMALSLEGRYHHGLANLGTGGGFDFKTTSFAVIASLAF